MKIFISSKADQLMDKVIEQLDLMTGYAYTKNFNYLELEVDDFDQFISDLTQDQDYSSIELKDIFILPLHKTCPIDFGRYIETKSLFYWKMFCENRDLVIAVEKGLISAVFQPIFDAQTLRVYGHECLSRARDVEGNSIRADRLFKMSKHLDLAFNLDRQCRINAIRTAQKTPGNPGKLFINFMPTVIYDPKVCLKTTHAVVEEMGINPSDIVFEVVESEMIEDYNHLIVILDHYKKFGYMTALDDVGAGYSTLSRFDQLLTNYIKVDISYINGIASSPSKQAYLDKVLEIKVLTGVKIIAEGIETEEDYVYVKEKGVDLVQGYYFAKPSPHFWTRQA